MKTHRKEDVLPSREDAVFEVSYFRVHVTFLFVVGLLSNPLHVVGYPGVGVGDDSQPTLHGRLGHVDPRQGVEVQLDFHGDRDLMVSAVVVACGHRVAGAELFEGHVAQFLALGFVPKSDCFVAHVAFLSVCACGRLSALALGS